MPRVLIADTLEPAGIELLQQAGIEVDNRPGLKGDDLKAALRAADAVIARSQQFVWRGIPSLYESHAFLLPVPFAG